jgi:hypothetical protein
VCLSSWNSAGAFGHLDRGKESSAVVNRRRSVLFVGAPLTLTKTETRNDPRISATWIRMHLVTFQCFKVSLSTTSS